MIDPRCSICFGLGWVCENHPDRAWDEDKGCQCGAGMPCACNRSRDIDAGIEEPARKGGVMPKENDLEGHQDQGGKHGGQAGMPKPVPAPSKDLRKAQRERETEIKKDSR